MKLRCSSRGQNRVAAFFKSPAALLQNQTSTGHPLLFSYRITRIIPAHAGNSAYALLQRRMKADHPRACGELIIPVIEGMVDNGSSPRMRGTLVGDCDGIASIRIIPAHAGNSEQSEVRRTSTPDHPRACGELFVTHDSSYAYPGSSPRMRGTHLRHIPQRIPHRIIPAHAGNSVRRQRPPCRTPDHPRACGELLALALSICFGIGSSPRMRGTPQATQSSPPHQRIIPAHAGNSPYRPP